MLLWVYTVFCLFKNIYYYYLYVSVWMHMYKYMYGGQRTTSKHCFSPSTMWTPGIELRPAAFTASTLIPVAPYFWYSILPFPLALISLVHSIYEPRFFPSLLFRDLSSLWRLVYTSIWGTCLLICS